MNTPRDYADAMERAATYAEALAITHQLSKNQMRYTNDAAIFRRVASTLRNVPTDHVRMLDTSLVVIALPDIRPQDSAGTCEPKEGK